MSISATDLIFYASANKPTDDTSAGGGAIDTLERVTFDDVAANDDLEVVSSNAADTTQQITVTARLPSGAVSQQTVTLNGTTAVILSTLGVVERVERVERVGERLRDEPLGLLGEDVVGDVADVVARGEHPAAAREDHAARVLQRRQLAGDRVEDLVVQRVALRGVGDRKPEDAIGGSIDDHFPRHKAQNVPSGSVFSTPPMSA